MNITTCFLLTIYEVSCQRAYITANELLHCTAYMMMETFDFFPGTRRKRCYYKTVYGRYSNVGRPYY